MSLLREYYKLKAKEEFEEEKELSLPIKRMYANERDLFMEMVMAKRIMEDVAADFKERTDMAGVTDVVLKAKDEVLNAYNRIWYTIPKDQRKSLNNNIDNAVMAIGVKRPFEESERVGDTEYGVYVTYEDMRIMMDALHDHCLVCSGSAQEQAACDLRKVIDRLGANAEHVNGECGYREMI